MKTDSEIPKEIHELHCDVQRRDECTEEETPNSNIKNKYTLIQWIGVISLILASFNLGTTFTVKSSFFPKAVEPKNVTPTDYGIIYGMNPLATIVSSPLIGNWVGRMEPKVFLTIGILSLSTSNICFGLLDFINDRATFIAVAVIIRIVEGVSSNIMRITINSFVIIHFSKNMSTIMGVVQGFISVGMCCGAAIGGALYDVGGYGLPFYVVGGMLVLNGVMVVFAFPQLAAPKEKKPRGHLRKFWFSFTTLVYAAIIFSTMENLGFQFATLEPHWRPLGLSTTQVGLIFSMVGLLQGLLHPLFGWFADKKCDHKIICLIGCILTLISVIFVGPITSWHLPRHIGFIIVSAILMGIGRAMKIGPSFSGAAIDTVARGFPDDIVTSGLVSSMISLSIASGSIVGPSLGGFLFDRFGYNIAVLVPLTEHLVVITLLITYTILSRMNKINDKVTFQVKSSKDDVTKL